MKKSKISIILGIMCFLITIAICIQVNTLNAKDNTIKSRRAENELRTQILRLKAKYDDLYEELEIAEKELEKARQTATNDNGELENLEKEIKKCNILLGNTAVKGKGIIITIKSGNTNLELVQNLIPTENIALEPSNILNIVNELKNAGAEAIEINGERIVNTSASTKENKIVMVNNKKIMAPFTITAIGLPENLMTLDRIGSSLYLYKEANKNAILEIKKANNISISKYSGVISSEFVKELKNRKD